VPKPDASEHAAIAGRCLSYAQERLHRLAQRAPRVCSAPRQGRKRLQQARRARTSRRWFAMRHAA